MKIFVASILFALRRVHKQVGEPLIVSFSLGKLFEEQKPPNMQWALASHYCSEVPWKFQKPVFGSLAQVCTKDNERI